MDRYLIYELSGNHRLLSPKTYKMIGGTKLVNFNKAYPDYDPECIDEQFFFLPPYKTVGPMFITFKGKFRD